MAYEIMVKYAGKNDIQTCKTLVNLAGVYQHFDLPEEACK